MEATTIPVGRDVRPSILLIESGAPVASADCRSRCRGRFSRHEQSLAGLFQTVAAQRADAPAISTPRTAWTYSQLLLASYSVAANLAADPTFQRGDRVILLLPNSPEYAAALYGVLLAGGVFVPVPTKAERGALQAIVASTEASRLIASPQVVRSRADLDDRPMEYLDLAADGPPTIDMLVGAEPLTGDELAAIFFTAGSTGVPRGVMLTHRNLIANARSIRQYLKIVADDRPLCLLPFHHAFGNSVLQSHLLAGAHLILDGQTAFPESILTALARHEATSLSGVPDLFQMLLERTSLGREIIPGLRYMAVAGGSLRHELALEVSRRIAPADFVVMYGQTEATARLAYVPPHRLDELPAGCIGRAVPDVTLDIVDEQDHPVPAGEVGELRARGPNVMLGYWRDPAATAERIRGGWLYTGDLAARDADGWIYHKGRRNALVKIAGFRVHPSDLEDFAIRCLAVSQAAAVAYETPRVGTRLALFVVSPSGGARLTLSEMIARCRAELPRHVVPEIVQILDHLPLNHAMKIDRPLLVQMAERDATHLRTPA